ncbi:MAG: methyltransferase domain-containing protein [Alphaproteobacteria bacterium]|nr:methyltransferase domain-containing protein [Alphaproteobacteria bacterium]MBO7537005.1 methyltransferase domain-containing protein [Alphaproteobacteria bacterium]MBO7642067.1 methyltransferase domain-containing protein [Alphaproteobacteria bacterium]
MKYSNVTSLEDFYTSRLGSCLAEKISQYLSSRISCEESTLILGYGDPYLNKLESENLFYAIPAGYKTSRWPSIRPFQTVVVDEKNLPFLSYCFDKIIVINFFEFSKHSRQALNEISRCLKINGDLIIIALNKNMLFRKIRHIRNSITEIFSCLNSKNFALRHVFEVGEKSFHEIEEPSPLLLKTAQIFYDMVVLDASREIFAEETVFNLQGALSLP